MTVRTAGSAAPAALGADRPGAPEIAEDVLVLLALLQSVAVGAWLLVLPASALRLGGFPPAPPFFVRWAGASQIALAAGYFLEWRRHRRVTLLVVAKAIVALFLVATWQGEGLPSLLMLAIPIESAMSLAGVLVHPSAERARRARGGRLRLVSSGPGQVRPAGRS